MGGSDIQIDRRRPYAIRESHNSKSVRQLPTFGHESGAKETK